jgi:predicted dehydrogenase
VNPGFEFPRQPHMPQSMYDLQMKYFVECIRLGKTPIPGGLEGWINMKIVDAAYQSSSTNQLVHL